MIWTEQFRMCDVCRLHVIEQNPQEEAKSDTLLEPYKPTRCQVRISSFYRNV